MSERPKARSTSTGLEGLLKNEDGYYLGELAGSGRRIHWYILTNDWDRKLESTGEQTFSDCLRRAVP
jgi:hypothetical protein